MLFSYALFENENIKQIADVLLPVGTFAESAGTFINCEGRAQIAKVAASPKGQARPAWKVLRVLGNFTQCEGFEYVTLDDVIEEITTKIDLDNLQASARLTKWRMSPFQSSPDSSGLFRIADIPMYRGDSVVRHAAALQSTADNPAPAVSANTETVKKFNLNNGDQVLVKNGSGSTTLPLVINSRVPDNCVYIPAGFSETAGLGGHVNVRLERI